jgi:hypothetical protein
MKSLTNYKGLRATLIAPAMIAAVLATGCTRELSALVQDRAETRARAYLDKADTGRMVLGFLHFGADYNGHEFIKRTGVVNGDPGDFSLTYRYHWQGDGSTDLAFICHSNGKVYFTSVVESNGKWSKPFVLASASIWIAGEAYIESEEKDMTPEQLKFVRWCRDHADAKSLLELTLAVGEP